jgi:hypothetical protein
MVATYFIGLALGVMAKRMLEENSAAAEKMKENLEAKVEPSDR